MYEGDSYNVSIALNCFCDYYYPIPYGNISQRASCNDKLQGCIPSDDVFSDENCSLCGEDPVATHRLPKRKSPTRQVLICLDLTSPYAPIPSASGFGVGFGCVNTFSQGSRSSREV